MGKWKGLIRLIKDKDEKSAVDNKELLIPKELFLRLYILRGTKLMPMDSDGTSDPYLKIKVPLMHSCFRRSSVLPSSYFYFCCVLDWEQKIRYAKRLSQVYFGA